MKCPGQDSRYWKTGAIFNAPCPRCQASIEFFKDDTSRKCHNCGHRFVNPAMDFGCAAYCQFAEQCLGDLPPELAAHKESLLKDRVAVAMKRYLGKDFKRIGHAMRVSRYAEQIGKALQANLAVVLSAAFLHDIGMPEAERHDVQTAPQMHAQKGPPIARQLLTELGARPELIEQVCDIIARHHEPPAHPTPEFACVYDADYLVNLEDSLKTTAQAISDWLAHIEKSMFTTEGRRIARAVLASSSDA